MSKGLQVRSQDLIRNYLKRISASSELSLGPVHTATFKKKNEVTSFVQNYLSLGVQAFLFISYLLLSLLLVRPMRKQSFLVENFQRKKGVFRKVFMSAQLPLLIGAVMLTLFKVPWSVLFLFVLVLFITIVLVANRRVIEC